MSERTVTRRPRQRRPLPPVHGSARMLLPIGSIGKGHGLVSINSKSYLLRVHADGYRLSCTDEKRGPVVYDIALDCASCDCPDFIARADLREDRLCKHCKALGVLKAAGKLKCDVVGHTAA